MLTRMQRVNIKTKFESRYDEILEKLVRPKLGAN